MGRHAYLFLLLLGCEGTISSAPAPVPVDPNRVECGDRKHPAVTELHRLTPDQYKHAITDIFAGKARPSALYPGRYGASVTGYSTEEAVNEIGEQGALQLMRSAEAVAIDVAGAMGDLLPCSLGASPGQACLDTYFDTYARRAFRRALTTEERSSLQNVFDAAVANEAEFKDAVAIVTAAVLQSPQFLYVVEDAAGTGRALSSIELASRLSFLLWDSVPDDALLSLAEADALLDPEVLSAQAQRMLASPRADPALTRYFREWTQARPLLATDKDSQLFPYFDTAYASSLGESFDRFVLAQVRGGGTLESLFTSTDAYVDERLAPSYGVTALPGQWTKVTADATRYAGLITHPELLASNAHPTSTSFVFRGRMIQRRFLCTPMGTPPANANAVFQSIPLPENPLGREVSEAVRANPVCAGCHKVLDPPGLALEHFDATGRYRETSSAGRTIDPSGTLIVGGELLPFSSSSELAGLVADRPEAIGCTSAQLFRFTFSRQETEADACALQTVSDALTASGGDLSKALLAITNTEAFTWRVDP